MKLNKFILPFVLVFVYFGSFIITTIVTDTICRYNGYYDEGIADSAEVGQ